MYLVTRRQEILIGLRGDRPPAILVLLYIKGADRKCLSLKSNEANGGGSTIMSKEDNKKEVYFG